MENSFKIFKSKKKVIFDIKHWIICVLLCTGTNIIALFIARAFTVKLFNLLFLTLYLFAIPVFIVSILSFIYIRVEGTENTYYQLLDD